MRKLLIASLVLLSLAAGCGGDDAPPLDLRAPRAGPDGAKPLAAPTPLEEIRRNDAAEIAAKGAVAGKSAIPLGGGVATPGADAKAAPVEPAAPAFAPNAEGALEVAAGGLVCTAGPLGPVFTPAEKGVPRPELALRYTLEEVRAGGARIWRRADGDAIAERLGDSTVRYRHAGIEERYEARREGVEQSFLLAEASGFRSGAEVAIVGKLGTALKPDLTARKDERSPIPFGIGPREVLSYGSAVAIDAAGRRLDLRTTVRDRRLEIAIDGTWLAQASFPVAVDPLIGAQISPSFASTPERFADVAYSPTSDRFLVVWQEEFSTSDHDVIGAMYAGDGTLIKGDIQVDIAATDALDPKVAWQTFENKFLVVWEDYRNAQPSIFGRIVDFGGNLPAAAFPVYSSNSKHRKPDVGGITTGGGGWLVVWELDFQALGTDFDAAGTHVSPTGASGGLTYIEGTTANDERTPAVNQSGAGTFFVAWIDNINTTTSKDDLWGKTVTVGSTGTLTLGAKFAVASDGNDESDPDVARNGSEFAVAYGYNFGGSDPDIRAQRVTASGKVGSQEQIAIKIQAETQPAISFYSRTGQTPEYMIAWKSLETSAPNLFATRRGTVLSSIVENNFQLTSFNNDHAPAATARTGSTSAEHWVAFERLFGTTDYDPRVVRLGFVPSTAPVANFTGTPTTGTNPLTVQFDSSTSTNLGTAPVYAWTFGDGGTSAVANPSHTYQNPGSYTVTLTITGNGGLQDIETKSNYIVVTQTSTPAPTDTFQRAAGAIRTDAFPWRTGGDADWAIDTAAGANGTSASARAGTILDDEFTRLEITASLPAGGGAISFFRQVTSETGYDFLTFSATDAVGNPLATRDYSGTIPFGLETFSVTATGRVSFVWEYAKDSSITASGEVVRIDEVTFPASTTFVDVPDAKFSAAPPLAGQAPFTVTFTSASLGSTANPINQYVWNFGDGTIVTTTSAAPIAHTYNTAVGSPFNVSLQVRSGAGNETDTELKLHYIAVTASPNPPVAAFAATPLSGVAPLTVQFTDQSTNAPTGWAWDFDNNGTTDSTLRNPTFTYASGTYTVKLTASNAAGSDDEVKANLIAVAPSGTALAANFTPNPTSGPSPLTVQFTDTSTGNPTSWSWDLDGVPATIESTAQRPSFTYSNPTTQTATVTVTLTVRDAGGASDSTQRTITILPSGAAPVLANFSASPTAGRSPLAVQFSDLSTGPVVSWLWSFGDGLTSVDQNPSHTYLTDGTYTVFLTVSDASGNPNTLSKVGYVVVGPGGSTTPGVTTKLKSSGGGGGCSIGGPGQTPAEATGALAPIAAGLALVVLARRRRLRAAA